jgi:hypothetical protein
VLRAAWISAVARFVLRRRAMRLAPLLLALGFALTASSPCVPEGVDSARGTDAAAHAHGAVAREDAARCHEMPRTAALRAPCPCGCGERAPANVSVGSLGAALLPETSAPPEPSPFAPATAPARRFASAPARAIDKVPRGA